MGLSILSAEIFFFFFLFLFFVPSPFCQHHCCPLRPPKRILSTDPRVRWQWLRLCPPATSLSQSQWCSPRQIGTRWRRGGNVPRSADRSIRKIPIEIRARSMQKLCTDRISIGSSEWWRNCSNKNRKYRKNRLTSIAKNGRSVSRQLGLPPLVEV